VIRWSYVSGSRVTAVVACHSGGSITDIGEVLIVITGDVSLGWTSSTKIVSSQIQSTIHIIGDHRAASRLEANFLTW
jgi:hypothetical protein